MKTGFVHRKAVVWGMVLGCGTSTALAALALAVPAVRRSFCSQSAGECFQAGGVLACPELNDAVSRAILRHGGKDDDGWRNFTGRRQGVAAGLG